MSTLLLQVAGAALAWVLYSLYHRWHLQRTTFAAMQLLAETRAIHGEVIRAKQVTRRLKRIAAVPPGWHFVAGNGKARGGPVFRAGQIMVCQFDATETLFALYLPPPSSSSSSSSPNNNNTLAELIAQRTTVLEEDMAKRARYMTLLGTTSSCLRPKQAPKGIQPFKGRYIWCFRDYVTYEELFGMLSARFCVEKILFNPSILSVWVSVNGGCQLQDSSTLFGFIPLQIHWQGNVDEEGVITWETTALRLGWRLWGKTFERPAVSERLRQDKWYLSYPKEHETKGDIVVLYRENHGRLIYKRAD